MKSFSAIVLLCLAVAHGSDLSQKVSITPIERVMALLESMLEKGNEEKAKEDAQYAEFQTFCDDTTQTKQQNIDDENDQITNLDAAIAQNNADITSLSAAVAEHQADIARNTGNKDNATSVRNSEKAEYDKTHLDYSQSVDALNRAIATMANVGSNVAGAEIPAPALAQIEALRTSHVSEVKDAIGSLMQLGAAPANAYDFQSSGIVGILNDLLTRFTAERTSLEDQETTAVDAFNALTTTLSKEIDQSKSDLDTASQNLASTQQTLAKNQEDLRQTTAIRDSDVKYLAELVATCTQKATDYASRSKLRADELAAVSQVINVMQTVTATVGVNGNVTHKLGRASAFASLRAKVSTPGLSAAARFLREKGNALHSKVLLALAQRAEADPLAKVKQMIQDLMTKLHKEAGDEQQHKEWCDAELDANERVRIKKTNTVNKLTAESASLNASIEVGQDDSATLAQEILALQTAIDEATSLRNNESATNAAVLSDCAAALSALSTAMQTMEDFYAKAGQATALVQGSATPTAQPDIPVIFDSNYQGMQGENGGVMALLEVIQSDFARLQSQTTTAENTAANNYEEFMITSKTDKTVKQKEKDFKDRDVAGNQHTLSEVMQDLDTTQQELDAATGYYADLQATCVDKGTTFEERATRRQEEIDALNQALTVLAADRDRLSATLGA